MNGWAEYLTRAQREVLTEAIDTHLLALALAEAIAVDEGVQSEVAWKHYLATELRRDLEGFK